MKISAYGITILRVVAGVIFVMHAYLGGLIYGPAGLTNYMLSRGIPFPALTAWFTILGHLIGGLMLVIGMYTRIGALIHVIIMAGTIIFVHFPQGFFLTGIIVNAEKGIAIAGGYEYVLTLFAVSVSLVFLGGGPLSIDALLSRSSAERIV